jgi:predicted aconitase with swiveling domain
MISTKTWKSGDILLRGSGLPSQHSFEVTARALVTDIPITYLGYVDPETGIVTEPGHPLHGQAVGGKVLVYPRGSGSTVAPYVLMGLSYGGKAPAAILNRDVCPLTLPAASIQAIPYGHGFDADPTIEINSGDLVKMTLNDGIVSVTILDRSPSPDKAESV